MPVVSSASLLGVERNDYFPDIFTSIQVLNRIKYACNAMKLLLINDKFKFTSIDEA